MRKIKIMLLAMSLNLPTLYTAFIQLLLTAWDDLDRRVTSLQPGSGERVFVRVFN